MDDKEFLERVAKAEENNDCPENLVRMASTDWQKQVAIEFVLMDKKVNERNERFAKIEKDIHWVKWLAVSVFGIVVFGTLTQYWGQIQKLFGF